ncbi:DUF4192 domain-containing protein [Nocardia wallacei]|uniref:DUF4192 domain-containing protein n=1 Tax=Nocardia wallacei TaxID=480035 RepID=UPI0024586612|nr:DUF4192 domain-containing protein [Nocardia wallacei]
MLSIENPGAVIAAIPGWLAYTPRRSVVLVLLSHNDTPGHLVRATRVTRVDLYDPSGTVATQSIAMAAFDACAYHRPAAVCAVVVDDTADTGAPAGRYRDLVVLLRDRIAVSGTPLWDVWVTAAIETGQPWWSLLHPDTDTQPAAGTPTPGLLAPGTDRAARTAAYLADPRHRSADPTDDGRPGWRRDRMRFVRDLVQQIVADSWPPAEDIAELAVALRDPVIGEICCALTGTRHADAARTLWTLAWQTLPPGDRADAALLLAVAATLGGDLSLAAAAVRSILVDDPAHHTTRHLPFTSGDPGVSIGRLRARALVRAGRSAADELGIDLD